MAVDEYSGVCDICNKPADARIEDCHTLFCTANCHRETGDLYHADCLKKFIASGAKGTAKHIPKIPYTNFACPKGKGKGSETPCKGVAAHCKRVIVKAEPKSTVPPQVLLQNERRQKPQPKPAKQAAPQKPAKPKAPPVSDSRPQLRLPPMPVVPKADPLGRNLNGQQQQELPPGYCEAAQAEAEKAKQGKAAKKNQKRAAKRKEELGSQWEASSANGSTTDASGMPPLEDFLGPSASQVSLGSGWNNAAAAAGDAEGSVASTGRFITDIDSYHALLAKHLDYSDSDVEYADSEDEEAGDTAESAPAAQWSQQQLDSEDTAGWQSVGGRGKVTPPAPASAARSRAESTARPEDDPEELRLREEELLKAALEASLGDAAGPQGQPAAAAAEDDYEAALARAMRESLAIEEAQRQREQAEQAALYAAIQARQQQQQQQQQQGSSGGGSTPWSAAAASTADSSAAWGTAAGGDSAAAAASWGVVHSQQQQPPQAAYTSNPYTATPAVVPSSIPPSYSTFTAPQAAVAASATPTALAATYSAPSAATIAAAYQPAAVPQQVPPVPWLQPAAISAPVMPAGYGIMPAAAVHYKAAPAAAAPAAAEDDDDLDSLLALLNV